MRPARTPIFFDINGDAASALLHTPCGDPSEWGLVVVVGGPQTRVGSHRAFVKLADALAQAGIATLRFDARGMGDSHGAFPGFEHLSADINASIVALQKAAPQVRNVILWGLCDGASAILLSHAQLPPCVRGAVLVNPWVHQTTGAGAATAAKVQMQHYYLRKLTDVTFWKKLLSGGINPFRSASELATTAKAARGTASSDAAQSTYVDRMREGWMASPLPILVITAGDDLVAQEWNACLKAPAWSVPRAAPTQFSTLAEANHTFSTAAWRAQVETWTIDWIRALR